MGDVVTCRRLEGVTIRRGVVHNLCDHHKAVGIDIHCAGHGGLTCGLEPEPANQHLWQDVEAGRLRLLCIPRRDLTNYFKWTR